MVSIYCPHCHRYTALDLAYNDEVYRASGVQAPCIWYQRSNIKWWIGICNNCKKPVLVGYDGSIIYPHELPSPSDERIPEEIRKDLDEAKLSFSVGAYRGCAVLSRRAVQVACIEKKAQKNRLQDQIDELFDMGIITKGVKDWAHSIRWIGNDAAHPNQTEVDKEDAEEILNMAVQFFEIIYVTPKIAEEQKKKRKK